MIQLYNYIQLNTGFHSLLTITGITLFVKHCVSLGMTQEYCLNGRMSGIKSLPIHTPCNYPFPRRDSFLYEKANSLRYLIN